MIVSPIIYVTQKENCTSCNTSYSACLAKAKLGHGTCCGQCDHPAK